MNQYAKAVYHDGSFVVHEPLDLPQDAEVQLIIQGPLIVAPPVADAAEKARILSGLTERMRLNPLPANAPRFSRDDLHARR